MSTRENDKFSHNGVEIIEPEEIQIPVPWGHISGQWWGSMEEQPVVALHGWQDNSGTFDKLAPLIANNVSLLCIDLPGHGFSSHLHDGAFYYVFWDGVILLRRIVKHYKWDKWWGPKYTQPIITLHGRQDNAGSFDRLMPKLCKNQSFLCLDLPGHGHSSHLSKGQYYYVYWEGVMLVRRVVKHFQWSKIKLMGHSLGGAIGFLYTASYPNEVEAFISLDIASPTVKNVVKCVDVTGEHIDKYLKYERLTLDSVPCYEYNEMIDIVMDAYGGSITRDSAEVLMRRGMQPAPMPGKHYFSRDPRLKVSMLGILSLDLTNAYAEKITCPYLNIRAKSGLKWDYPNHYQDILDIIKKSSKKFEYHEVDGTHHVHLNNPENVAPIVKKFLESLKK